MKYVLSYRVISLLLAVLIFISSSGISLSIHYCNNKVYDYSLIGKVEICKKNKVVDAYSSVLKKSGCCSFDHFKIETSNFYKFSEFDKENIVNFDFGFAKSVYKTLISKSKFIYDTRIHPPPHRTKNNDLYLKIESLLI